VSADFKYKRLEQPAAWKMHTYFATFKGVQIANFQNQPTVDNIKRMYDVSDKAKTTLVVSHQPIDCLRRNGDLKWKTKPNGTAHCSHKKAVGSATKAANLRETMIKFVSSFPDKKATHLSGHTHNEARTDYNWPSKQLAFTDHTAPYPHETNAGMLAILVSPTLGVLQVDTVKFEGTGAGASFGAGTNPKG